MRFSLVLLLPFSLLAFSPVDVLRQMNLEEKVGQLFVAPACPLRTDDSHLTDWKKMLKELHIGNVILKQSDPESQKLFLEVLQKESQLPLMVLADAEWGFSMRMTGVPVFPRNMTLGAIQDLSLIERMGKEIAREARILGVHMNLAPVVDVNNDPNNPIIHMRSFGDKPNEVGLRAAALIRGMHKGGLLTCIKHFPGHGDTQIDSHSSLPVVEHSLQRLKEVELPSFEKGIATGTDGVMSAHILVKALDSAPATLSPAVMTDLLRGELGFGGLILTDALNMKALLNYFTVEEIVIGAHKAGADLLLYGDHITNEVDAIIQSQIPKAHAALLEAYSRGDFSQERLDASVLRILQAKVPNKWLTPPETILETKEATLLQKELYQAAITKLGPDFSPINPDTNYFSLGGTSLDLLMSLFCPCICHTWENRADLFIDCTQVVVSLRDLDPKVKNFGLKEEHLQFFTELSSKLEVIYCVFGTPYAAALLPQQSTILIGYEDGAQNAMTRVLTGQEPAKGALPVTLPTPSILP